MHLICIHVHRVESLSGRLFGTFTVLPPPRAAVMFQPESCCVSVRELCVSVRELCVSVRELCVSVRELLCFSERAVVFQ